MRMDGCTLVISESGLPTGLSRSSTERRTSSNLVRLVEGKSAHHLSFIPDSSSSGFASLFFRSVIISVYLNATASSTPSSPQGEYIAPEKIEMLYDRSPLVGQCMIYGHSLKSTLVAIVIPDELAAASWAESKGITGSFEELCKRDDLKEEIMKQVWRNCLFWMFRYVLLFRCSGFLRAFENENNDELPYFGNIFSFTLFKLLRFFRPG